MIFAKGWNVAYRKLGQGSILDDLKTEFRVISNSWKTWCADPFVFEYNNKTYIFAEVFDFFRNKAGLGYCVFDEKKNSFSKWKTVIREEFHLSYPFIFEQDNNIYIMPESSEGRSLVLYKATDFPDKWIKEKVLLNDVRIVDSTIDLLNEKKQKLGLTYELSGDNDSRLVMFSIENSNAILFSNNPISSCKSIDRPGGRFFKKNNRKIRVSQDCEKSYGYALNFFEVESFSFKRYKEELIKYITPDDINIAFYKCLFGIHTYNATSKFEVVDVMSKQYNPLYIFARAIHKIRKNDKNEQCFN